MELVIRLDPDEALLLAQHFGSADVGTLEAAIKEKLQSGIDAEAKVEASKVQISIADQLKTLDLATLRRVARSAGV